VDLSPLTYFSRGARAATHTGDAGVALSNLAILTVLAAVFFAMGAALVPRTE
jgi:ABC-2 type transport system permease protein